MNLESKKFTLRVPGLIMDVIPYKDVKEKALEFEEILSSTENYKLRKVYREIMGDFNK